MPSTNYAQWVNLVATATESEVNIANNTSKVTVVVQLQSTSTTRVWNETSQSLSVSIDGTSAGSRNFTYSIYNRGTVTLATYSRVVTHNSDGTKSARVQVSASGGGDSGSLDFNLGLTTIARASEVSLSPSTVNFGSATRITIHKKSSGFTSTVKVVWNGSTTVLWNKTSSSAENWTLPQSWAPANSTSGSGQIVVETYNGTTLVGTREARINGSVPNNATFNPTANTPTFTEKNTKVSTGMSGVWVAGQSKIEYKATFATRVNATAKSAVFRVVRNGVTFNHAATISGTTATFSESPSLTTTYSVRLVLTDSRGRVATGSASSFTMTAYSPPKLTIANANRSVASATSILASVTAVGSSVSAKNTMTLKIHTKPITSSSWTLKHTVTSTNGSIALTNYVMTGYAETSSFNVRFELYDELANSVYSETTISTTKVLLDAYKDLGIGIGQMYDPGVGGALQVEGSLTKGIGLTSQSTNSNGTYLKFDTGVMICFKSTTVDNTAVQNAWGGIFANASHLNTGEWPSTFISTPFVWHLWKSGNGNSWIMATVNQRSTETLSGTIQILRGSAGTSSGYIQTLGIGWWK